MATNLINFIKYCLGYIKLTRQRAFTIQQKYSVPLGGEYFNLIGLLNVDIDGSLGEYIKLETFYKYDPKQVPKELKAKYEVEKQLANKIEEIYNKYKNDQFTKQIIFNFGYFEIEIPIEVDTEQTETESDNIRDLFEPTIPVKIDRYPLFSVPIRIEKEFEKGVGRYMEIL